MAKAVFTIKMKYFDHCKKLPNNLGQITDLKSCNKSPNLVILLFNHLPSTCTNDKLSDFG